MADLEQWRPAVPDGEELLAAAPMFGEWRGPAIYGWRAALPGAIAGMTYPLATFGADDPLSRWWVVLLLLLAIVAGSLLQRRWWGRRHPVPSGMAAAVDWKWGRGPVLLVTGSAVRQVGLRGRPVG